MAPTGGGGHREVLHEGAHGRLHGPEDRVPGLADLGRGDNTLLYYTLLYSTLLYSIIQRSLSPRASPLMLDVRCTDIFPQMRPAA